MITWRKQGTAWVGSLTFKNGSAGNVLLVAPRDNPKGAVLVFPDRANGALQTMPLAEHLDLLSPELAIDILCMQERQFGQSGLPPAGYVG